MPNTEVWGNLYIINDFQHDFMKWMSYLLSNWVFIWRFRPSKVSNTVFSKASHRLLFWLMVLLNLFYQVICVTVLSSCASLLVWSWLFHFCYYLFPVSCTWSFLIKQALRNIGWKLKKIMNSGMTVVSFIVSMWTTAKPYFSRLCLLLSLCVCILKIKSSHSVPLWSVIVYSQYLLCAHEISHSSANTVNASFSSRISWALRVFSHPFLYYLDFHYLHVYPLSCSFWKYLTEKFAGRT